MIIYEVNLSIKESIVDEYIDWLEGHIKEILELDGFVEATLNKINKAEYSVQYHVETREKLEEYFNKHAQKMRSDGINRFGNQFSATRRIMEVVRKY